MRIHRAVIFSAVSAVILLGVCYAHYPENARRKHYDPQSGHRFRNLANTGNSGGLQVFLAFSGGETRAAALSSGVLEALALQDAAEKAYFEKLPTSFNLPPGATPRLWTVAGKLLNQSEAYRALLHDLTGDSRQPERAPR